MNRQSERLSKHCEGDGRLLADGTSPLAVRYVLDTWCKKIATGSGTSAEIKHSDGLVWWEGMAMPMSACTLETSEGRLLRIDLFEFRSNRARFFCQGPGLIG